jgi:hypothetical protein
MSIGTRLKIQVDSLTRNVLLYDAAYSSSNAQSSLHSILIRVLEKESSGIEEETTAASHRECAFLCCDSLPACILFRSHKRMRKELRDRMYAATHLRLQLGISALCDGRSVEAYLAIVVLFSSTFIIGAY